MSAAPPPLWDADRLVEETQKYWALCRKLPKTVDLIDLYVNGTTDDLLPHGLLGPELRSAQPRLDLLRTKSNNPCDILVLMVGYSFEPLLQTVCAYNPTNTILLVPNRSYGAKDPGRIYGDKVKGWIDTTLRKHAWITENWFTNNPAIECAVLRDESAASIFRILHDEVSRLRAAAADKLHRQPNIVVDVTGGKKNMDAGAFLYAAYSGLPVSYVNFTQYDPLERRPYGYSCDIGPLENPYEAFRLRDWEELRSHYEGYRFEAARATLKRISGDMVKAFSQPARTSTEGPQTPSKQIVETSLAKLEEWLTFYAAWEAGEYVAAYQLYKEKLHNFRVPEAVKLLGPEWEKLRAHTEELDAALPYGEYRIKTRELAAEYLPVFKSNKLLLTYAEDERSRIRRLYERHEDYRSAFLRAAGLDEFLLKARLVRLWDRNRLDIYRTFKNLDYNNKSTIEERKISSVSDRDRQEIEIGLAAHDGGRHIRWALSRDVVQEEEGEELIGYVPVKVQYQLPDGRKYIRNYRLRVPKPPLGLDTLYEENHLLIGEAMTQLRNQASHAYLYISPAHARNAIDLVESNIKELRETGWARLAADAPPTLDESSVRCEPWDKLLHNCGLTFLPQIPT